MKKNGIRLPAFSGAGVPLPLRPHLRADRLFLQRFQDPTRCGAASPWTGTLELFQNRTVLDALQTTLLVSVLATVIATIVGTAAAIGFSSMRRRTRTVCLTVNNIPLTNADIITGVSMMLLFVFAGQVLADLSAWLNGSQWGRAANLWFDFEFKLGFVHPAHRPYHL